MSQPGFALPVTQPVDDVANLRGHMAVTARWVYLDHAAVSPLPRPAANAVAAWAADVQEHGVVHWSAWRSLVEEARRLGAALLNAAASEVALIRNTTEGIALIAEGWRWQPGDSVVVPQAEFPSNLYPWLALQARGVDVRCVPVSSDDDEDRFQAALAAAVDASTRVIACSLVDYASGRRRDVCRLSALARRCGARLFIDAIQGLGVLPVDVQALGIDFLAADGHKWLLGPEGAGLLYVRTECLNELRVPGPGWNSVVQAGNYADKTLRLKPAAERYEAGTYNMAAIAGLHASLRLLSGLTDTQRESRLLEVRELFAAAARRQGLSTAELPPSAQSGILALHSATAEPRRLMKSLLRGGVVTNVRDGRLRVSPHLYNTAAEADAFGAALAEALQTTGPTGSY